MKGADDITVRPPRARMLLHDELPEYGDFCFMMAGEAMIQDNWKQVRKKSTLLKLCGGNNSA